MIPSGRLLELIVVALWVLYLPFQLAVGREGREALVKQCFPNLFYNKNTWGLLLEIAIQ